MQYRRICILFLLACLTAAYAAKKKNPDDVTQTLELPKDPPMVAIGETGRLVFHVSPLSAKGLLSQQTRDALKAILKMNGGAQLVHVRAFVAGSGDLRRVPQIVSEILTERKMSLPSVSVVQGGALPLEAAQVVLETVSMGKKEVNPGGLIFVEAQVEAQVAVANSPSAPLRPLLDQSLARLAERIQGATALKVSCFVSDLTGSSELSAAIAARFPAAVVDLVQTQRASPRTLAACEGIARAAGSGPAVKSPRLAFTGTQAAFGVEEQNARQAFQRLDRELAEAGVAASDIVSMSVYPLSLPIAELAGKVRPPQGALTMVPFEGVASIDSIFAVDAVAAVPR
jgi:enamine deaminase RidA (YjgF/YER057c/UK114 family)